MSFFSDVQTAQVEESKDVLGGNYGPLPSGVYDATIKYAYAGESKRGAKSITFGFQAGDKEFSETMYITNAKKQTYYERDGKKYQMVGYELAESISILSVGKKLPDLTMADKVIELYDWETKSKKPTKVNMFTDLIGKEVKLGLHHVKEFKKVKQGNDYVDSTDIREYNSVNKVFRSKDDKTVNEIRAKKENAEFMTEWSNKWTNQVNDKTGGAKPTTQTATTKNVEIDDDVFA